MLSYLIIFLLWSGVVGLLIGSNKLKNSISYRRDLEKQNNDLQLEQNKLLDEYHKCLLQVEEEKKYFDQLQNLYNDAKASQDKILLKEYTLYKQQLDKQKEDYENNTNDKIKELDVEFRYYKKNIEKQRERLHTELNSLKETLNAAAEAARRQQELEAEKDFYKIQLDNEQLEDIIKLKEFAKTFRHPDIVNKIIWSSYIQKATSAMCVKVLGAAPKGGIYKITNLLTNEMYIGQSVDIATRWKQHIKKGLGIEASQNKLYTNMNKYGVWNFTFELLEECKNEKLNEKERFFIELYQADKYLNGTKGNK